MGKESSTKRHNPETGALFCNYVSSVTVSLHLTHLHMHFLTKLLFLIIFLVLPQFSFLCIIPLSLPTVSLSLYLSCSLFLSLLAYVGCVICKCADSCSRFPSFDQQST